jgi:DEAD/DEAH box helicase/Helicase C-terminal domain
MVFRLRRQSSSSIENPEVLFRDLRNRSVEGLLSQQADMLRKYMDHIDDSDVAMQMPTGSGKTLVGLLIAEWRRRTRHERGVYLCPTRQLVNQVVEQASQKYGIHAVAFIGSQRDYNQSAKSRYTNADILAVTTYSGLFNTNPFFSDAQLILLDDAHAAENYVGSFWSLCVEKWNEKHDSLFATLLSVLKDVLPVTDYSKLAGESEDDDRGWMNKLPSPVFYDKYDELLAVFDTHCSGGNDLRYKWSVLRDHMKSCHLYYGWGRFLLRPLISPTESHAPFSEAAQRVYMSATLGEGGELERLVGKRKLTRIPAPEGWDRQGIGRRLFFFPTCSMDQESCNELVRSMLKEARRGLVLTPSEHEAEVFRKFISSDLPDFQLFNAKDIESSKHSFVSTDEAIAIVANRYDGIDLVGEECRLLIASGLPRATNLQEQFLISRMAVPILYNDRIRTRIVQAIGRCTRNSTDYAAVVVLGEQLNKFLFQSETRKYLHPELQAEIEFGIEESKDRNLNDFLENLQVFLEHDDEWDKVDEHIMGERDRLSQEPLPCDDIFIKAVPHEVSYQYALWNEDFQTALDEAKKVLTTIEGPEELRGYRAFWMYLAGNAAWLMHKAGVQRMDATARDYYGKAAKAAIGVSWLHELARRGLFEEEPEQEDDAYLDTAIEQLERHLESLGTVHDLKFEKRVKEILDGLRQTEAETFERSQVLLGQLLGYAADNSADDSAPDPWWVLTEKIGIVFEDYTNCNDGAVISTKKVRQAVSHPSWLSSREEYRNVQFDAIFLTSANILGAGARSVAGNCYYWKMNDFIVWAETAITAIREVRRSFQSPGDLVWRAEAKDVYMRTGLNPAAILDRAHQTRLNTLSESNRR